MRNLFNPFARLMQEGGEGAGAAGAPATATTVTTTETAPASVPSLVNADGTFVPDWHKQGDFAGIPGMDRFPSVKSLALSYKELEKKLGAQSQPQQPAGRPAADAPVDVVAKYRADHGIPEKPEGYQLKPENMPEGLQWSDELGKTLGEAFHKHHVPAELAKELAAEYVRLDAEQVAKAEAEYKNRVDAGTAELKAEWGDGFDRKIASVKSVVASLGFDPGDPELFANPKNIKFLGKVVEQLQPDTIATFKDTVAAGGGVRSGKEEAHAIMTDPSHPEHTRYMQGDQEIIRKVTRLSMAT